MRTHTGFLIICSRTYIYFQIQTNRHMHIIRMAICIYIYILYHIVIESSCLGL